MVYCDDTRGALTYHPFNPSTGVSVKAQVLRALSSTTRAADLVLALPVRIVHALIVLRMLLPLGFSDSMLPDCSSLVTVAMHIDCWRGFAEMVPGQFACTYCDYQRFSASNVALYTPVIPVLQ